MQASHGVGAEGGLQLASSPHSTESWVIVPALGSRPPALTKTDPKSWHQNKICSEEASNPVSETQAARLREKV